MRLVVYVYTVHFATRSKVSAEGIGLKARDAIALRTLCMGKVGDGEVKANVWNMWGRPVDLMLVIHQGITLNPPMCSASSWSRELDRE